MKTIFYIPSKDEKSGNRWFNDKPYNVWFILENILYEPNGNILKNTVIDTYIKSITLTEIMDRFDDNGITRHIALYISE